MTAAPSEAMRDSSGHLHQHDSNCGDCGALLDYIAALEARVKELLSETERRWKETEEHALALKKAEARLEAALTENAE